MSIVEVFLSPILELRASAQSRPFLRFHARLHTEPPNRSFGLRKYAYDTSTQLCAAAPHKALPRLSHFEVHWRMALMNGAYLQAPSDAHRTEYLAPHTYDAEDAGTLMKQTVAFIAGGITA